LEQRRLKPLSGRNNECAVIRQKIDEAVAGKGGIVLISGEPGVGKTRLGEEALALARDAGLLPLTGHAYEEHGAPFIVSTEILENAVRVLPRSSLLNVLGATSAEMTRILPELRRLYPDTPQPLELPPEQQQRYLFNAVLEFITRLAQSTPVIMLLDDMHWADESSALLLEHLAPHLPALRILLVITHRDSELDIGTPFRRVLAGLVRQDYVTRIALRHLDESEVADVLANLGGANPPAEIVKLIFKETEGNAFFVQSVFQHLAEEGRLFDAAGDWRIDIDFEKLPVPDSVRLVIQQRLERLGESTRDALRMAAVVGFRFDPRVMENVAGQAPDTLLDALEQAESAQLILPVSGQRTSRFEFSHALVRQTLLEGVSHLRLEKLHLQIADAMEALFGEDRATAADIALHLFNAGGNAEVDRTVRFLKIAADRASEAAAMEEAVEHLEKALALVPAEQELERAELLFRCGVLRSSDAVLKADADLYAALDIYSRLQCGTEAAKIIVRLCFHYSFEGRVQESLDLCRQGLSLVGEEPSAARCSLLSALGLAHALAADVRNSKARNDEALAMAQELGDLDLLADVLRNRAINHWQNMDGAGIAKDGGRAAELNRAGHHSWDLGGSLAWHLLGLTLTGEFATARELEAEVKQLAVENADIQSEMMCELARGMLESADGHLEIAIERARRSTEINDAYGMPWAGHFYGVLALYQMRAGLWDDAHKSYQTSLDGAITGTCWDYGDVSYVLLGMAMIDPARFDAIWERLKPAVPDEMAWQPAGKKQVVLAATEALAVLGRMDEAAPLYPLVRAQASSGEFVQQFHTGLVEKTAGIGALAAGDFEASEQHFMWALQQADELPYATEQGEVRRWYATLLLRRGQAGDSEHARRLLEEACSAYNHCKMPKHLDMTKDLLARM
jgi:tetratricopeptide (TPR) repeat protein